MIPRPSFDSRLLPENNLGKKPVFRFDLRGDRADMRQCIDAVIAAHLRKLCDILIPTQNGVDLRVDGFRMVNDVGTTIPLYVENSKDLEFYDLLEIYEPRLAYLRDVMESMLSLVQFESGGKPVFIDGFRLKDPLQWLTPCGGAMDILAHAGTRCNLQCRFCYNLGSPPLMKSKARSSNHSYQDILARIDVYQPGTKQGIFPLTGSLCEILNHPEIKSILTALRRKTPELIRIPTNGSLLTGETIDFLSSLKPLFVDISLNSASPSRRSWLMKDPKPKVALGALAGLRDRGIPFSVVIVPWPFPSAEEMLRDLERTVRFSQIHDPAYIQISLPGYSRFFSEKVLFDHERVWNAIREIVLAMRTSADCPLILRPGLFEEYTTPELVNAPRPSGIIRNSPAARSGVRPGDLLLSINGLPLKNRVKARFILSTLQQSDLKRTEVVFERNRRIIKATMDLGDFSYPFDPEACPHLGIVFPSAGIPVIWVEKLAHAIRSHQACDVLVMTSRLVAPTLKNHLRNNFFNQNVRIQLCIPPNRYLGGNIFMGDLLTVDDFILAASKYQNSHRPPDLIVIPDSPFHLSGWGRDLTGKVYIEVERRLNIPVALIPCGPIFD